VELFTSFDAQLATILLFIVGLAGIRIHSDIKEVTSARHLNRLGAAFILKNNTPRVSVIIELKRSAETIFPLLDHLYNHHYENLEVIVLIKHTAGKSAQPKLHAYRRKHQTKSLKLVKHHKGMTCESVICRNATGDLVLPLSSNHLLSRLFFSRIALLFLDDNITVVKAQQKTRVGMSFASAHEATRSVWRSAFEKFTTQQKVRGVHLGYIYRRTSILAPRDAPIARPYAVSHAATITDRPYETWQEIHATNAAPTPSRGLIIAWTIASSGLIGVILLANYNYALVGRLLFVSYVILFSLFVSGSYNYSTIDKITLLLFAPLSIFSYLFTSAVGLVTRSYRMVGTMSRRLKRRLLLTKQ
jgi:hypothetical protein